MLQKVYLLTSENTQQLLSLTSRVLFFLTPKIGLERDPSNPVTALDSAKKY